MADPSIGLNAQTGGTITGWSHVLQSVENILTTRFGARIMREYYGSFFPPMLGRANISRQEAPLVMSAIATAIMQWEPRIHITSISIDSAGRDGALGVVIDAEYRPRATYGDLTAESGSKRITVALSGGGHAGSFIGG